MTVRVSVNGVGRTLDVPPVKRLLDVLREDLRLTGTKEGCGEGECGSCAVLMNGELVNSCLVPVLQIEGAVICTIEGVAVEGRLGHVQRCFLEEGGAQCGICTPGMILATHHLLERYPSPTMEQIQEGLAGNLCRCTGYMRIFEAVRLAAAEDGADAVEREDYEVIAPVTLNEALRVIADGGHLPIAGGTELMVALGSGRLVARRLVSLHKLRELRFIEAGADGVAVGSGTTFTDLRRSGAIADGFGLLAQAASWTGRWRIRTGDGGGEYREREVRRLIHRRLCWCMRLK